MKTKIKKLARGMTSAIVSNLYRIVPAIVMVLFCSINMFAAGGEDPFSKATGELTGYLPSIKKLTYVIAAIIALVGAFNIYHKMTNGDQDVKKTVMLTFGGVIAMVILSEALPAFFGHTV